jgi:hypothetical protein
VEAIKLYPQFLIERWREQLRRDLHHLVSAWESGYFDYNLGDSCTAYSHCPFVPLCSSPHPENWYSSYEIRRWNPLNRNPSSAKPAHSGNGTESSRPLSSLSATTSFGGANRIPATAAIITK